jgi:proline iminopeptidase
MAERYPAIDPYESGMLAVGSGHEIYWEAVGDEAGEPVVWLHGGPGSGCGAGQRRLFDPGRFRAVLFDQRGCGRSRPLADSAAADLSANTTAHLVSDIELLRERLGIERWVVTGTSWGVTLALAYAQLHPDRVTAMVLAAVTAGRRKETDWITRDMRRVFPREWDAFAAGVPASERDRDLPAAYARLLASSDAAEAERAALNWCVWEDTHVSLAPGATPWLQYQPSTFRQVFARLVTHYWSNGSFLDDAPILSNMDRIGEIPAVLIHGRYDISGPLDTAWDLHRAWPASRLVVLENEGHGGDAMTSAIVEALDGLPWEQDSK